MIVCLIGIGVFVLMYVFSQIYHSSDYSKMVCQDDVKKVNDKIDIDRKISTSDVLVKKAISDGCINIMVGNNNDSFIKSKLVIG